MKQLPPWVEFWGTLLLLAAAVFGFLRFVTWFAAFLATAP